MIKANADYSDNHIENSQTNEVNLYEMAMAKRRQAAPHRP
jgi:hypothetical protein